MSQARRCGEMRILQITQEFKNKYEAKMKQIDAETGGVCVQAKISLQQDWIRDLTEQNDMLARLVEELELEATHRVTMLEQKLQHTSKCACEVMESYDHFSLTLLEDFQKMDQLQSDVQNLLELIRRAKQEGNWNFDDLKFYGFDLEEVFKKKNNILNFSIDNNDIANITNQQDILLKQKNKKIKELEEKLTNLVHSDQAEEASQFKNLSQQYSDLKKSMMDMREALTAEVANKHDTILSLRRDVQVLEEQCRKVDQQTHFKDDIIKEIRKEIKQLKRQDEENILGKLYEENLKLHKEVKELQDKLVEIGHGIRVTTNQFTRAVQTTFSIDKLASTEQNNLMGQIKDIFDGVEKEKLLILGVDQEVRTMLKEMYSQEKLLLDQSDLIVILVHKLFVVFNALTHLEERAKKFFEDINMYDKKQEDLVERSKEALLDIKHLIKHSLDVIEKKQLEEVAQLEEENQALKVGIETAKKDLVDVQLQAKQYLKERDGYILKHKESLEIIETLQKENNITRKKFKVLQEEKDTSIDSLHSAHIIEVEEYEKKYRESIDKIDKLRIELKRTKANHKDSMDQIITLNNENHFQNQRIEALQGELRLKSQKPKTNTVSLTASISTSNFSSNISPATKDKAINNIPVTQIISTSTDLYDDQIMASKVNVGVAALPIMLSQVTSVSQFEKLLVATKANVALQVTSHKKEKKMDCDIRENSSYRNKILFDDETIPKQIHMRVLSTSKKGSNKYESFPAKEAIKTPRSRSLSPNFVQKFSSDDVDFESFVLSNPSASTPIPKKTRLSRNRTDCVADEECSPTCDSNVTYLETTPIPVSSKSRSPSPQIQEMTVTEINRASRNPSPSRTQNKSKTRKQRPKSKSPVEGITICSGSEIDEVLGHVSAKYVEATGLSDLDKSYGQSIINSLSKRKSRSQSPKGKMLESTTSSSDYTPDFEVAELPSLAKKPKVSDYLNIMDRQVLEAIEVDSQNDHRFNRSHLIGSSSNEEIEHIVRIEILNKVMGIYPEQYTTYSAGMLCPSESNCRNKSSNYSHRSPVQIQPLSWESFSTKSGTSVSSFSDTQLMKPVTATLSLEVDNSKLKSAVKHRPRSRSTSSATDELQSVVNSFSESAIRLMMKSPNEKVSRQKIAQLEEQLRRIHNKDEMIKIQNETLNIIQVELQALKQKEHEVEVERKRHDQEVENLKLTIKEMEKTLCNSQEKSQNLQKAVDLNMNTMNLLEVTEEHLKTEVARQSRTIINLQDVLVSTKHQLEEIQQKYSQEAQDNYNMMNTLMAYLQDAEEQCVHYKNRFINVLNTVEYLRDVNLNLEVENFELVQDLSLLESRLLKYQQMTKIKECLCGLKIEVRKLSQLKKHNQLLIKFLKQELRQCGQELTALKLVLESESTSLNQENIALTSMVRELEAFTQSLQNQLEITEANLSREKNIKQVQTDRIEELQNIIDTKNVDINRYSNAYQDVKTKLDAAVSNNRMLQESIKELQEQFNEVEMQKMIQVEKQEICHGEIDICLNSLQEVKFKLHMQHRQLVQKIQECKDLEANLKIQSNNTEIYKKDLENTMIRHMDEAIELKRTIRELKEKLQVSENKIEVLNEEVKNSQAMLIESAQREMKMQQELSGLKQKLSEKIQGSQVEEMRLVKLVNQLEQQLSAVRNEILMRDQQLELTKTNMHKIRNDYNKQTNELNVAQEEVNTLKNELNVVIQEQGKLKSDNEKLQKQVTCLKNNIHFFNQRDQALTEKSEAATDEINTIQSEKQHLQDKNEEITSEVVFLKDVLQKKTEAIANLEMELMQAKANRRELCVESRNVVASVRTWLDEQKMINERLKEKLHRKNSLIMKLQKEKEMIGSLKNACPAVYALKQHTDSLATQYYPQSNHSKNWSLGSRGSGSQSPASSNDSGQPDWYVTYADTEYITPLADASPQSWLHRVESMTEELQRSNRYWKKQINDNEFTVTKDE